MEPGKYNLVIRRGKTFSRTFSYANASGAVNLGTLYTGARLQIRPATINTPTNPTPSTPALLDASTSNGLLILGHDITFSLTAAQTAALAFTAGVYELELYNGSGATQIVDSFVEGSVTVKGEVTLNPWV